MKENLVVGAFLAFCLFAIGLIVYQEVAHPCVRTEMRTRHEDASSIGTTMWVANGSNPQSVGLIALDHDAREITEEVCVERK